MTDDHAHRGDDVHHVEAVMLNKKPDWEGFGRAIMSYGWPTSEIDGSELFDLSLMYDLLAPIKGGYNPDEHIDAEGICPERGDDWYEYNFGPAAPTEDK